MGIDYTVQTVSESCIMDRFWHASKELRIDILEIYL